MSDISPATNQVSYPAWINKIKSELKGRALDSFDYAWDGEKMSPFEEKINLYRLLNRKKDNDWLMGVEVSSAESDVNGWLLKSLELGASTFCLNSLPSQEWKKTFKNIHLDWITSEFKVHDEEDWDVLAAYLDQYPGGKANGVCWSPEEKQIGLFNKWHSTLPQFRYLTFSMHTTDTGATIAKLFETLIRRITKLSDHFDTHDILSNVAIKITGGEDLVLNIAMLRALRLLWMQVLNSLVNEPQTTTMYISGLVPYLKSIPSDQMISSSLIAGSMILGGVDALFIADPDLNRPDPRWGLMTQHIIREEAFLHLIPDPLAGSFVIERLTGLIAKKVWNYL